MSQTTALETEGETKLGSRLVRKSKMTRRWKDSKMAEFFVPSSSTDHVFEQLPDALTELGLYDTPQARAAVAALDITNATEFDMAQFRRLCKSLR